MVFILHTYKKRTGRITINLTIVDQQADETFFHVVVTGQREVDPAIFEGDVSQSQPLTFENIPFDEYVITETETDGYSLVGITPEAISIDPHNPHGVVEIVNDINALELTFDDIANVPVADPTSVSDWNTFFDLPTNGTPFDSVEVIVNTVKLYGGNGITISSGLFLSTSIIHLIDSSGCIEYGDNSGFDDAYRIESCKLPHIKSIGNFFFYQCRALNEIYIPTCDSIGENVGNTDVFMWINSNIIKLTIPTTLMTCNAGNPDGDIQYLIDNNTVTIYDPDGNQIYPI